MQEALVEAKKAFNKGETPIGAVLVYQDQIIARGHNLVESDTDATQHAELICLKEGAKVLNNWRLCETTLYVTIEPCMMCLGAMVLSRVKRLVYGADGPRHGALKQFAADHPIHSLEIEGGVLSNDCARLMSEFFKIRRHGKLKSPL